MTGKTQKRILIGSPVNQTEEIFSYYLQSLNNLVIPENHTVDYYFIVNGNVKIINMLKKGQYDICDYENDFKIDTTHRWNSKTVDQVASMRNAMLSRTVKLGYDYLFMVDSDLMLHPNTLKQLVEADKGIIAELFWTQWDSENPDFVSGNVWHIDNDRVIMEEYVKYETPGVYQVGFTGACTLISRNSILKGFNFNPITNISFYGEDRWACIRANALGIPLYIETTYPCIHLYNKKELEWYRKNKHLINENNWLQYPVKKNWVK